MTVGLKGWEKERKRGRGIRIEVKRNTELINDERRRRTRNPRWQKKRTVKRKRVVKWGGTTSVM